jgi:hypothetical protein
VQKVDLTHAYQHEEIESQIWETPLVEKIGEVDRLLEHLLSGLSCSDVDALLVSRDDHSTCLDTSIWDPGANDSSRVSAQEDTTSHKRYSMMQREITSSDGVQWHTRGPKNIVDSGQINTLSCEESFFGDFGVDISRIDTSSEGYEVAPQHDYVQESNYLT